MSFLAFSYQLWASSNPDPCTLYLSPFFYQPSAMSYQLSASSNPDPRSPTPDPCALRPVPFAFLLWAMSFFLLWAFRFLHHRFPVSRLQRFTSTYELWAVGCELLPTLNFEPWTLNFYYSDNFRISPPLFNLPFHPHAGTKEIISFLHYTNAYSTRLWASYSLESRTVDPVIAETDGLIQHSLPS